jgi:protein involved in polysaccharide export with SLBB domain
MNNFVLLMSLIAFISCASSKKSEYLTINDAQLKIQKKLDQGRLGLVDIKNVPKFNARKKLMAAGFVFTLNHPTDDQLRGTFRTNFNGVLRLPYNVKISVVGKTFNQLNLDVKSAYKKFFQKGVNNVVLKVKYRQYYVDIRGFVNKPGKYLVTRKSSLDKVIDSAGGLKLGSEQKLLTAKIKQVNKTYAINLNKYFQANVLSNTFTWTGGDSIYISTQNGGQAGSGIPVISVMSGVRSPGKILYEPGENLFYYLQKSGGMSDTLAYDESYIMRNTDNGLVKIQFNLVDTESIPVIYAGDVIMLNAQKRTPVDRMLDRIGQIGSILSSLALLVLVL